MSVEIAWKQNNLVTDFHLLKLLQAVFEFGSQAFVCEFSRQTICSVGWAKVLINTLLHHKTLKIKAGLYSVLSLGSVFWKMAKSGHFHEDGKEGRSITTPIKLFSVDFYDLKSMSFKFGNDTFSITIEILPEAH